MIRKRLALVVLAAVALGSAAVVVAQTTAPTNVKHPMPDTVVTDVDGGTGCQYLVTASGGITPRLYADGQPMCGNRGV